MQNDDFHPNFIDKITHLIFACVKFHPFLDGNKRTAIHISYVFC
ncbi:Fic family protein [Campylobacter sputorum]